MTKWWRKLSRKRYIWCVVVMAFDAQTGASKDPYRVGPFYSKSSAAEYRKKWDAQFRGFAVVDKYPNGAAIEGLVAMQWNT